MAITLPEHLREVLDVLGFHFPAINEDILEEHARAWKAFTDELEHIIDDTDRAARLVADQNYGQAIDAFNGFWQGVGGQGDLRLAQEASQLVASGLDISSDITVVAKKATIAQASAAAISLGIGIAGAIVTGGISAVVGLAASQGFRIALREIIQEAISRAAKSATPKMRREAGDRLRGILQRCKKRVENFKAQAGAKIDELGGKLDIQAGPDFAMAGGGKWPRRTKGADPKPQGRMLIDSRGGGGSAPARHPKPMTDEQKKLIESLPHQEHHYATNKRATSKRVDTYTARFTEIADRYGLDLDEVWNKESLPHRGRHPDEYHDFVEASMVRADREARGDREKFLALYNEYVKEPVRANPMMLRKDYWR